MDNSQPASLTNREMVDAGMSTQPAAIFEQNRTWVIVLLQKRLKPWINLSGMLANEAGVVSAGNEADFLGFLRIVCFEIQFS